MSSNEILAYPPPTESEYSERDDDYLISAKETLQASPNSSQMYQNLSKYTGFHFKICNTINTTYFSRDKKTRLITLLR